MGPVDKFHPIREAKMGFIVHAEIKADGEISTHLIMSNIFGCMEKRQWASTLFLEVLC